MRRLLVLLVLLVLVVVALGAFAPTGGGTQPAQSTATCGVERWPVKTLSDPKVVDVDFTPHDSSIGRLRNRNAPKVGKNTPRIDGVETTTYRVSARLLEFKFEDDRDIHLVVGVPSAPKKTMIVEFPDPTCPGAKGSPKKARMSSARSALIKSCGKPPSASSRFRDLREPRR